MTSVQDEETRVTAKVSKVHTYRDRCIFSDVGHKPGIILGDSIVMRVYTNSVINVRKIACYMGKLELIDASTVLHK